MKNNLTCLIIISLSRNKAIKIKNIKSRNFRFAFIKILSSIKPRKKNSEQTPKKIR